MIQFADYKNITFRHDGRVLVVTLNRPDQLNAVNAALHSELARLFVDLRRDPHSDVVVLTGAGHAFCAGGDIDWMQSSVDTPANFQETMREAKDIVFGQLDLDKPLICRLNGHAIGLGATLALLCDCIIMSNDAKIGDPHVSVGLVAGDGGALIWPQLIGYAKAKLYLMTGKLLAAAEAERIGLITQAVPHNELDAAVDDLSNRLARGATKAIRWTKLTANLPLKALLHAHFDAGVAYEGLSQQSSDHREAVAAFRSKRKPDFTGQ